MRHQYSWRQGHNLAGWRAELPATLSEPDKDGRRRGDAWGTIVAGLLTGGFLLASTNSTGGPIDETKTLSDGTTVRLTGNSDQFIRTATITLPDKNTISLRMQITGDGGFEILSGTALGGAMPASMLDALAQQISNQSGTDIVYNQKSGSGSGSDSSVSGNPGTATGSPDPDDEEKAKLVSNPKHHPNSASPEPTNVQELYDESIVDNNGVRWAKDSEGNLHRFSKPSNGETHWNGSTAGDKPIRTQDIPNCIKKALGFKG
ncbi:hypothetical protein G6M50_30155 [Agrobacterium rhizogenes]|nr:hypothetical protein [Rhizobium rhizogenes]NTJ82055.1 hypothetical protein [Rhizobium rhizogenes]